MIRLSTTLPIAMLLVLGCGDDGNSSGGDCRELKYACADGFSCQLEDNVWNCHAGAGSGGASGDVAGSGGPPNGQDLINELTDMNGDLEEGMHETSGGTVNVMPASCEMCGFVPGESGIHYWCDEDRPGLYWMCVQADTGKPCFYIEVVSTNYGRCGGYGAPDNTVNRECRELDDYEIECFFPNVTEERITYCKPAECSALCTSGIVGECPVPETTAIEFCVEMDNVVSPRRDAYCVNYYQNGENTTTREPCPFVAAAPECSELGIASSGGGGSGDGASTINRQCVGLVECSGGSMAQCVSDNTQFYEGASPEMQKVLRDLVASCSNLSGCAFVECTAL